MRRPMPPPQELRKLIARQVEKDEPCRAVLRSRIADGMLHRAPIHHDVTQFDDHSVGALEAQGCGGGFPCQA